MEKDAIADFILKNYGLQGDITPLGSYIDTNFMLVTDQGNKYIFKLSSPTDSIEFLKEQSRILVALASKLGPGRHVPCVVPSRDNLEIVPYKASDGKTVNGRLLSFIEGEFFANVAHSSKILFDLGVFLGEMDQILQKATTSHIADRKLFWDLQNFPDIEEYIICVEEVSIRRLVRYFLLQFRSIVQPVLRDLRKQVIHNDANDWNLLIREGMVTGIIDFGDMVLSQTVNELAIALTYAIMGTKDLIGTAIEVIRGYHSVLPLEEREIRLLYYLIATRLSISLCMSARTKKADPSNKYASISGKPATDLLTRWIEISPLHATNRFMEACGHSLPGEGDHTLHLKKRQTFISSALSLSYDEPIRMVKAAFQYMYDDRGNTYLDCVNNICHVGHCHPRVVEAGQKQMANLNTNTRYLFDELSHYSEKLCATFPGELNKVFFVNSGSAATDLALRLARTHTNRERIIVVDHAYHGNISSAIEISPYKFDGKGGMGCVPTTLKTMIPDTFRGRYRKEDPDAGYKYAADVEAIIGRSEQQGKHVAAFICESIIGCGGQVMLPPGYLQEVYRMTREKGGICIADEVQVGFGRVGSAFWGFELQDVVPDIVILGKPMGNGHPLSAVITTKTIARSFENGMEFFSSFGGNPVSCAIGEAVLDVIIEEGLRENALETGNFLQSGLIEMQKKYPIIGDVRGSGLFIGIEFVLNRESLKPATRETKRIVEEMKKRKILVSTDGPYQNVIKFKPPMVFSLGNAGCFLNNLADVLKKF